MGRIAVLTCDQCGAIDQPDGLVLRVAIAGPRFDLCPDCRLQHIMEIVPDGDKVRAYVAYYDEQAGVKGGPRPNLTKDGEIVEPRTKEAVNEPSVPDGPVTQEEWDAAHAESPEEEPEKPAGKRK